MKLALALFVSSVVACGPMMPPPNNNGLGSALGGSGSAAPGSGSAAVGSGAPVVDPASVPGFPGVFTIVDEKFYLGNDLGMKLGADGVVSDNESEGGQPEKWNPIFRITADGKLLAKEGNALLGAFSPDGTFKSSHGEVAPFKLVGDALVIEDKSLAIDASGTLTGAPSGAQPVRVDGATDAGARRAALFVLALAFSQGDDKGPAGGGAGTPPPPTAPPTAPQ